MRTIDLEASYKIWSDSVYRILMVRRWASRWSVNENTLRTLYSGGYDHFEAAQAYLALHPVAK